MCKLLSSLLISLSVSSFKIKVDAGANLRTLAKESFFIFSVNHYEESVNDNTVSTFMAKNPRKFYSKPDSLKAMWFSTKEDNDLLISAKLHLYRECSQAKSERFRGEFRLHVYRLSGTNSSALVGIMKLPANKNGWFIVDVTECYKSWSRSPKTNYGLAVVTESSELGNFPPEDFGVVGFQGESQKHPFMVAYFKNEDDIFTDEILQIFNIS